MAKRNISEEINSVTFPDRKEYEIFEKLILSGTEQDTEEAFLMIKKKTEAKRRRKVQIERTKEGEILW